MSKLVDWFKWKLTGHLHISQDKPLGFGWYSSNLNQSNDKFLFEAESCELAIQRELEQTGQIFRVLAVFYYIILWSNPWTIWTGNPAQPSAFNILILIESFWHFSNRFEVFDILFWHYSSARRHMKRHGLPMIEIAVARQFRWPGLRAVHQLQTSGTQLRHDESI